MTYAFAYVERQSQIANQSKGESLNEEA